MSSLIKTKSRLNSTKSTQKVIKAMELVASSKIKKAREKAQDIDFYFETTLEAMGNVYSYPQVKRLLNNPKAADKTLFVAITSDMGLCGGYNSNVISTLLEETKNVENSENIIVGSKGVTKLEFEGKEISHQITNYNLLDELDIAKEISDIVIEKFNNLEINNVKIIYTKFVNPILQEVQIIDLFNIEEQIKSDNTPKAELAIEPDEQTVFKQVLEQYVLSMVYTSVLQSFASEHSYRRNSMESANKNSLELIDSLNLELNRIRQANITQEISEIIGGSEALNN